MSWYGSKFNESLVFSIIVTTIETDQDLQDLKDALLGVEGVQEVEYQDNGRFTIEYNGGLTSITEVVHKINLLGHRVVNRL